MRSVFTGSLLLVTLIRLASGQSGPVISPASVISAASYAPIGGNAGLAEGSYISVFGANLGPSTPVSATLPLSASLGGSTVTITPASGSAVQAYLEYVSSGQINAILPSNTPTGAANVTVTYNGGTSPPVKINVVPSSFGIFTQFYGEGPAATINVTTGPPYYNLANNSANPGDVIELYGTGLGPISVPDTGAPGAVVPNNISVQVLMGNQLLTPSYAGRQGSYPGLDQINFTVPSDGSIPASCFVPITVIVNGVASNFGTMGVASSGRACPPPFGLTTSTLLSLENGGSINGGLVNLSSITTEVSSTSGGQTLTLDQTVQQTGAIFSSEGGLGLLNLEQTLGGVPPVNPPGTCIVEQINAPTPPTSATPPLGGATELNAGTPLMLSGPGGSASLAFSANGYSATLAKTSFVPPPPALIQPGLWTMSGPGGGDIGPFTASITVPTPLTCTNCSALTSIDRSQPLTINWTGGGGSQDWVEVAGISTTPLVADTTKNVAGVFFCAAHASDQALTVPANILAQIPAAGNNPLAANYGTIAVINVLGTANSFTAPLTAGGNLDLALFSYSSVFLRVVAFK
jgi:uncharacterized protein (TIGR03437 family)